MGELWDNDSGNIRDEGGKCHNTKSNHGWKRKGKATRERRSRICVSLIRVERPRGGVVWCE